MLLCALGYLATQPLIMFPDLYFCIRVDFLVDSVDDKHLLLKILHWTEIFLL